MKKLLMLSLAMALPLAIITSADAQTKKTAKPAKTASKAVKATKKPAAKAPAKKTPSKKAFKPSKPSN